MDEVGVNKTLGGQPIIEARALSLGYGSTNVLRAVDLRVSQGDSWFLLGQNGTGKSTLLNAFLELVRPQAGAIWWHPDLARRDRIGFVPQRCELNPNLPTTIREFVPLGLVGVRVNRREREQRLAAALEKTGLIGLERRNFWTLSGGLQQRCILARALALQPSLLIMDEPTAGLDPAAETSLLSAIAVLNRAETLTVVCVTHDLATAARYATHVALLHDQHIQSGPARDILSAANLQRVYGVGLDVQWRDLAQRSEFADVAGT